MNSQRSTRREIPTETIVGVALLSGAIIIAWFGTTLLIHDLLKRALEIPADAGYRDGDEDMAYAMLLPFFLLVPFIVARVLWGIEVWWRNGRQLPARLVYLALSLALLIWSWWSLNTSLSYGFQNRFHGYRITDTIQAAAYASIGFPLALACACVLLALLRRAPVGDG